MACLALENVVKLELIQELADQDVVNSLYFQRGSAWNTANATILAQDVWDWWVVNIKPFLASALALNQIRVTDMTSSTGFVLDFVDSGGPASGTSAAEPLPNNVACVVSFKTGLRGRANRGRVYLAGFIGDSIVGNNWVNAVTSGLVTSFETLQASVVTASYAAVHVVYSCQDIGSPAALAGVATPITSYIVNPVAASQRRRLPGRGR